MPELYNEQQAPPTAEPVPKHGFWNKLFENKIEGV
jgi:hypothetical protein